MDFGTKIAIWTIVIVLVTFFGTKLYYENKYPALKVKSKIK